MNTTDAMFTQCNNFWWWKFVCLRYKHCSVFFSVSMTLSQCHLFKTETTQRNVFMNKKSKQLNFRWLLLRTEIRLLFISSFFLFLLSVSFTYFVELCANQWTMNLTLLTDWRSLILRFQTESSSSAFRCQAGENALNGVRHYRRTVNRTVLCAAVGIQFERSTYCSTTFEI